MTALASSVLDRNLRTIARASPDAAEAIRRAEPRQDIRFFQTEEGVIGAEIGEGAMARALASRRRPRAEAERLIASVDVNNAAAFAVAGFGLGYHVGALAKRVKRTGLIVVFEPDVGLLRAVLENVDCTAYFVGSNIAVLTDPTDSAAMSATIQGLEGAVAMGVELIEHQPSKPRLGGQTGEFFDSFKSIIEAVKLTVVTTLVQVKTTIRNALGNLERYTTCEGIGDLAGRDAGRPAIVVSAGPSLERNIELLARPGVRDRFTIVAVQTALRPLLSRGIRPHFVTALDWSEASRRFYEGLTAADVEGVELIIEPKVNPAVPAAWPGAIRCAADKNLNLLLGKEMTRHGEQDKIRPGATVAHMAYYLARHLGCEPVALVGQDLGFTDGQYYSAGAAIHGMWGCELNEFNTLEMMEWQRIVRMGTGLKRVTDSRGRAMFTDEQMHTYLVQFERDFKSDAERGLSVIDATEGGVRKANTRAMSLAEFIERHGQGRKDKGADGRAGAAGDRARIAAKRLGDRVRQVRRDIWKVAEASRKAGMLLTEISEHHADRARVDRLLTQVYKVRDEVAALEPAYGLVQAINQAGTFNRMRADRALQMEEGLTDIEVQRRQIERDCENVRCLADSADDLGRMLDDAIATLDRAPKRVADARAKSFRTAQEATAAAETGRVAAVVLADFGAPGPARDLDKEFVAGRTLLRLTLERLSRCTLLDGAVVLTDDVARARAAAGAERINDLSVEFVAAEAGGVSLVTRSAGGLAARLWGADSWRGGLAGATCYDEAFEPVPTSRLMEEREIEAALIVGADWPLVDPALCDEVIRRYGESPKSHRVTFTQAAPGLCGCIVSRSMASDLARSRPRAGILASVGGVLGYLPSMPAHDLIAFRVCVQVDLVLRDCGRRFVIDGAATRDALRRAIEPLGERIVDAPAAEILAAVEKAGEIGPRQTVLEITNARETGGLRAARLGSVMPDSTGRRDMPFEAAARAIEQMAAARDDALVTLSGRGDPLLHPKCLELVRVARAAGVGVHIRTDLLGERESMGALLESGAEVISVDLLAESAAAYKVFAGVDGWGRARGNLEGLMSLRAGRNVGAAGVALTPWIVPRITRCDAVYEEIEKFYNRWLIACGWAVIDPLPGPGIPEGERIGPLPLPASAARRIERTTRTIRCDTT